MVKLAIRAVVMAGVVIGFLVGAIPNGDAQRAYSLARWAGMGSEVEFTYTVDSADDGINGGFIPPGYYCMWLYCVDVPQPAIMILAGKDVDPDIIQFVILHEVGHYLQWRELGQDMFQADRVSLEWDADIRAVDALCGMGQDGRASVQAFFDWIFLHFGYEGDIEHGLASDRVEHAVKASRACRVSYEAP